MTAALIATTSSWSSRFSSVAGMSAPRTRIIGIAADLQVQVGRAVVDGDFQQIVDVHVSADGLGAGASSAWLRPELRPVSPRLATARSQRLFRDTRR